MNWHYEFNDARGRGQVVSDDGVFLIVRGALTDRFLLKEMIAGYGEQKVASYETLAAAKTDAEAIAMRRATHRRMAEMNAVAITTVSGQWTIRGEPV